MTDCKIMPDDSLHPGPRFRSVIRRPFIEDGAHSFSVESQPESVLLRKLGNLFFSIFLVYRPNAFQVRVANHAVLPYAMHPFFDLFRECLHTANSVTSRHSELISSGAFGRACSSRSPGCNSIKKLTLSECNSAGSKIKICCSTFPFARMTRKRARVSVFCRFTSVRLPCGFKCRPEGGGKFLADLLCTYCHN